MFQIVASVSDELIEITGQTTANVEVIDSTSTSTSGRPTTFTIKMMKAVHNEGKLNYFLVHY